MIDQSDFLPLTAAEYKLFWGIILLCRCGHRKHRILLEDDGDRSVDPGFTCALCGRDMEPLSFYKP